MTYFYGINRGQSEYDAVSSTASTTSRDVEIQVNETNIGSRQELLNAVTNLINFILRSNYPL